MKVFASHNSDISTRKSSSAGGVFSILALDILSDGGVVYGVSFDDEWHIVHRRAVLPEELDQFRGSKYAYSQLGNSIQKAENDLKSGKKVLFSGTPCQIAAARKRLGTNENLLLVEVVCHGAPTQEAWDKYLGNFLAKKKKSVSDIKSINFRDKRNGWKDYNFTIIFRDGSTFTQNHRDNLYMQAFLKDLTLRDACFRCPFKYPNGSQADITIGDLWGIESLAPELDNNIGTTLVITRTPQGDTFARMLPNLKTLSFDEVTKHNPAIVKSAIKDEAVRTKFQVAFDRNPLRAMKQFASRSYKEILIQNLIKYTYAGGVFVKRILRSLKVLKIML